MFCKATGSIQDPRLNKKEIRLRDIALKGSSPGKPVACDVIRATFNELRATHACGGMFLGYLAF